MSDTASIRLRVVGPVLETISGVGHLLEALPARTRYSRDELLHEAEKLRWQFEAARHSEDAQDEVIFLFRHDI